VRAGADGLLLEQSVEQQAQRRAFGLRVTSQVWQLVRRLVFPDEFVRDPRSSVPA